MQLELQLKYRKNEKFTCYINYGIDTCCTIFAHLLLSGLCEMFSMVNGSTVKEMYVCVCVCVCTCVCVPHTHTHTHTHKTGLLTLTLGLLMSYIYGAPILDVSRSHTTTQQSVGIGAPYIYI